MTRDYKLTGNKKIVSLLSTWLHKKKLKKNHMARDVDGLQLAAGHCIYELLEN